MQKVWSLSKRYVYWAIALLVLFFLIQMIVPLVITALKIIAFFAGLVVLVYILVKYLRPKKNS